MNRPTTITIGKCGPIALPPGSKPQRRRGMALPIPPQRHPEIDTEPLEGRLAIVTAELDGMDVPTRGKVLYHRGYGAALRMVVGLGEDFYAAPLECTVGEETLEVLGREAYLAYILDEECPEAILRVTDRVAESVYKLARTGVPYRVLFSVVEDGTRKIEKRLSARYADVPQIHFVRASIVADDILDAGLSRLPSANSRTAMANLASFFGQLGKYQPTGPDPKYTLLREAFSWADD